MAGFLGFGGGATVNYGARRDRVATEAQEYRTSLGA
ncbi:hypothetical protein NIES4101_25110 (plasmid) [Calothrix sp. NIES-4101]|nr:hypothetical protein NIES4101_25110 [Calothrix sp. NIES-4101]